jgi:hypothetical protein
MCRHVFLFLCPAVALADEPSIQPALDAARRRDEQLKTVSVRWKVTTFVPKGGRMDADPVGLPLPRNDQTVESIHRLVLDGDRFREEHDDPGLRRQVPSSGDRISTFDGERSFHRIYHNGREKPADLIIERSGVHNGYGAVAMSPIALWCRGIGREPYAAPHGRLRTANREESNNGPVLRINSRHSDGQLSWNYSLDPGREYVVQRIRHEYSGAVELTDIEYREEPGVGWVPAGWTTTKTRDGDKLVHRILAEVTEVRVNEPIPPETFRLDPLPGETVTDNDAKKTYHVRDDGTLEEHDRYAMTVTPPVPPPRPEFVWPGRSLVRFVLLPALAVAILGGLIVRRRRRPSTPPRSS